MQQAAGLYGAGEWAKAEQLCRMILSYRESHFEALSVLADIRAHAGQLSEAAALLQRAVAADPANAAAHGKLGNCLQSLKRFDDALGSYQRALQLNPESAEAYNNHGNALQALKRFDAALESYERALRLRPDYATAYNNRGNALRELKRFDAALESYERALQLRPDSPEAYNNRGSVQQDLRRFEAAVESYDAALRLRPDYAEAHYNRGNALRELKRFESALQSYDCALRLKPDHAAAYTNRGTALRELKRFEAALDSYERAARLRPDNVANHINRGNVLVELKRFEAALESYERALHLKPDYVAGHINRGDLMAEFKHHDAALDSYRGALQLNSEYDWLHGNMVHTKMLVGTWGAHESDLRELASRIEQGKRASSPFPVLSLIDSLPLHRRAAETWIREQYPERTELSSISGRSRGQRIRVGYYSADLHEHPVALAAARLFELHDRERFEVTAFSLGPDKQDEMRARLLAAFERFLDVHANSDMEIAQISRDLQIDIAVDLTGFTRGSRTGIFAYRAAPLQVSYLGYPATMGAPYIDYLIADHTVIPEGSRQQYAEKIAYLPNSYLANDGLQDSPSQQPARQELGLPSSGFVFCNFNTNYKITPEVFDGWMRILRQVEGSVLWLAAASETAITNLRREAEARGVSGARVLFAPRVPMKYHLARQQAAGLFLDTLPYNAHSTAIDALRAGLPVLTRIGESFAARVAASLLTSIGLPELITSTPQQYETLAVELARDPPRLAEIRAKLNHNLKTTPLFDAALLAKHIEGAYTQMYERHLAGLTPEHIFVAH